MRYIYVLAVSERNAPPNVTHAPTLGAHTSEVKAQKHFDSVRDYNIGSGATVIWDIRKHPVRSGDTIREAYLDRHNEHGTYMHLSIVKYHV